MCQFLKVEFRTSCSRGVMLCIKGVSLRSRGEVLITRLQDDGLIYGLILTDDAVAAVLLAAIVHDKSLSFEF
jgi:hypothetical protein